MKLDGGRATEQPGVARVAGRGFAVSGGVAGEVVGAIKQMEPGREVQTVRGEGLRECKKMLALAKSGKYDGYLLEGMACPGGCVAGTGTLQDPNRSGKLVAKYVEPAPDKVSPQSTFQDML